MTSPGYWLFKSEPGSYSIEDLQRDGGTCWDGIRNYQVRNFLRDVIKPGDRVLYYHSNADPPAIVGTAVVTSEGYPDHTQFDANHEHFDPAASPGNPRWYMVDIRFEQRFARPLSLPEIRNVETLRDMELLRRGSRLSVQPVTKAEFSAVLDLAR